MIDAADHREGRSLLTVHHVSGTVKGVACIYNFQDDYVLGVMAVIVIIIPIL